MFSATAASVSGLGSSVLAVAGVSAARKIDAFVEALDLDEKRFSTGNWICTSRTVAIYPPNPFIAEISRLTGLHVIYHHALVFYFPKCHFALSFTSESGIIIHRLSGYATDLIDEIPMLGRSAISYAQLLDAIQYMEEKEEWDTEKYDSLGIGEQQNCIDFVQRLAELLGIQEDYETLMSSDSVFKQSRLAYDCYKCYIAPWAENWFCGGSDVSPKVPLALPVPFAKVMEKTDAGETLNEDEREALNVIIMLFHQADKQKFLPDVLQTKTEAASASSAPSEPSAESMDGGDPAAKKAKTAA